MGMREYANQIDITTDEVVKKVCPNEYSKLEQAIEKAGLSWEGVAEGVQYGNSFGEFDDVDLSESVEKEIDLILSDLADTFLIKTGLGLDLVFVSDNLGNVSQHAWELNGVYKITKEAKKFKKKYSDDSIKVLDWVSFG